MKRLFDISASVCALLVFSPLFVALGLLVKFSSRGPMLYWSDRVGRNNVIFRMPKFRTMRTDTPELATHLLSDSDNWITPLGKILRATSLDELPQLLCVIAGQMSLVGPRPALFNQHDLVELRTQAGVHVLTPGVTGWAQVNGRDELAIPVKVRFDSFYLENQSLWLDLRILFRTVWKVFRREGIQQADSAAVLPMTSNADPAEEMQDRVKGAA